LGLTKDLVLRIQLSQVVVHLDGGLGDAGDDLGNIIVQLGRVVGSGSTNGAEHGTANQEPSRTSENTRGKLNRLLLDGDQLASGADLVGAAGLLPSSLIPRPKAFL
jgi:hypothetical protein